MRSVLFALLSKLGLRGDTLPIGIGTQQSLSGGNSQGPFESTETKPFQIGTATSFSDSISLGSEFSQFSKDSRRAFFDSLLALGKSQSLSYLSDPLGLELTTRFQCSRTESSGLDASQSIELDPRKIPFVQTAFSINESTIGFDAVAAAISYYSIQQNAGPGVITIGGCDYHTGRQNEGDTKDFEIGQRIGRSVTLAFLMGKPLYLQIITDGGVYAKKDTRDWLGDSGDRSFSVIGYFNPKQVPTQIKTQVGYFTKWTRR